MITTKLNQKKPIVMEFCFCALGILCRHSLRMDQPDVAVMQGELEVTTEAGTGKAKEPNAQGQVTDVVDKVPFLFLGLDLPPAPLYKDVMETNIIPQVLQVFAHALLAC